MTDRPLRLVVLVKAVPDLGARPRFDHDLRVDHDADPVTVVGTHTGLPIDLGTFSRRRPFSASSAKVIG